MIFFECNFNIFVMKGYEKYNKINSICIHFKLFSIGLVSNKKFNYKDKKFLYGDWTSVIKKSQSKQEWFAAEARIANKLPQMTKLKEWIAETKEMSSLWLKRCEKQKRGRCPV